MYQPQDTTTPTYPVPQKINGRIISFISGKAALVVIVVGIISLMFYSTVGAMTTYVQEPLTDYEKGTALTELRIERAAVQCKEAKQELVTFEDDKGLARTDLTPTEKERYKTLSKTYSEAGLVLGAKTEEAKQELLAQAERDGISANTSDEELQSMIPTSKTVEVQSIDQVHRLIFFLIMPIGLALVIVAEPMGMQSLASMAHDRIQFNRRQKAFLFSRVPFDTKEHQC